MTIKIEIKDIKERLNADEKYDERRQMQCDIVARLIKKKEKQRQRFKISLFFGTLKNLEADRSRVS